MTKEEIIDQIKREVLSMNIRESYINDCLSEIYTKWYIDSNGDLYSIQTINYDEEPEAAFEGRDKLLWSIRPKDIENVQFDQLDEDGEPISDTDYAKSLTDEEFLDTIFGSYYDNKYKCSIDTDFSEYLKLKIDDALMKKYVVSIRDKVEDWEIPSDFWDDINYPDPYIEADCPEDAEDTARDFIQDCGDDPDKYDYLVTEYEE